MDGILADRGDHLIEHGKAFDAVLDHRVMLAVAAQAHALLELVHIVDMLHPLGVNIAQQADALQLAHRLFTVALFLRGQDIHAALIQLIGNALAGQLTQLLGGVVEIGGQAQPVHKVAAQTGKVPIIGRFAVQVVRARSINRLAHHLMQLAGDILAVQHHLALLIDDLTLLVHDIVILQHLFTNGKVGGLQLFLGALDRVGDELVLDGDIFVKAQGVHQVLHAVAAEDAHQVILQTQEEAGGTGVTLTAGTAAQLVIDTAALMALGADDEQAARSADHLGLALDLGGKLLAQLLKALAGVENFGVLGLGVAVALGHQHLQLRVNADLRRGGQLGAVGLSARLGMLVLVLQLGQIGGQRLGQLLLQGSLGHVGHIAAQHDVGAAACHVGGDGHSALLAGLRNDLRLALMLLGVQNIMLDAALFQQLGQRLALFNADRADQHGLALCMALRHLINDGVVLAVDGLVNAVGQVLTGAGLVGGDADNVQAVDFAELIGLGGGCTGHTGQLFVHTEVVLEGDGSQRLALGGNGHALLGLNGLMQALIEAAAVHQAAGELINDDDLAVLDDIVNVAVHDAARLDGTVHIVAQRHIVGIGQIIDMEECLGLLDAGFGQGGSLALFVHDIVAVDLLLGLDLVVQLDDDALLQRLGKVIGALVHHAGILALAADDQRGTGLVDQDGVHLVHDGKGVAALDHVGLVDDHVVAQVVKAELVVRAVGDIGLIGLFAVIRFHAMDDQTDSKPQEAVDLAHPLRVAAGQIVVYGDNMHTLAGQGVEVGGHGCHQRLTFTGLHLGNAGAVQHNAADDLHGVGLHAQHTPVCLAADCKCLRQNIIKGLALGKALLKLGRLGLQLLIGQLGHLRLKGKDLILDRVDALEFLVREGAEQFFKKRHNSSPVSSAAYRRGAADYIVLHMLL